MSEPDEVETSTLAGAPSDETVRPATDPSIPAEADREETAAERRARIVAAAYRAEYATGRRERTESARELQGDAS